MWIVCVDVSLARRGYSRKTWIMPRKPRRPPRVSTAVALAGELLSLKQSVHFVQVGAHFGDFNVSQLRTGVRGDSARRAVFHLLESSRTRAVLVEPHPMAFNVLLDGVRAHKSSSSEMVSAVNGAVCPYTPEYRNVTNVDFHVISPRFHQDYPNAPFWARSELSSLSKGAILRGVAVVVKPKDPAPYVMTLRVKCYHPHELLLAATIAPQTLDALVVDTEGLDVAIVDSFLSIPAVQPSLIIFEAHIVGRRELRLLLDNLRGRGYKLDCCGCTPLKLRDPLAPHNPINWSEIKKCDSGWNAIAWDPARLNLTTAVQRNPSLRAWYAQESL